MKPLHVFGMIIRDSEMDFIYVTFWGSKEYIDQIVNKVDIQSIGIFLFKKKSTFYYLL